MKREPADRATIAVDPAAARPGRVRRALKKSQSRGPSRCILAEQIVQQVALELGMRGVAILVETRKLAFLASRHAEHAIREDALIVDDVTEDPLQRPLSRAIGEATVDYRIEKT